MILDLPSKPEQSKIKDAASRSTVLNAFDPEMKFRSVDILYQFHNTVMKTVTNVGGILEVNWRSLDDILNDLCG